MIDLSGIMIYGIRMRESHLLSIRTALKKTFVDMGYYPYRGFPRFSEPGDVGDYERNDAFFLIKNLSASLISLTEIVSVEDNLWLDNANGTRKILADSKLDISREFLTRFAKAVSANQSIVSLLNEFAGGVVVEKGSLIVRFRDPIMRVARAIKMEAKVVLKELKEQREVIEHSLHQLGEWAWQDLLRPVLHSGIYVSALLLVMISIWFSLTEGVTTSLEVLGANLLASFKSALPLVMSIVWLACLIFNIATSTGRLHAIYDALQNHFSGSS